MADIVSFGSEKPPWRPSRRVVVTGVIVVAAAVVLGAVIFGGGDRGPSGATPLPLSTSAGASARATGPVVTGPTCSPRSAGPAIVGPPVALVIGCAREPGSGLDRRDRGAAQGPWTVVVRRADGSLGRNSAVITFPVAAAPPATVPGTRVWALAGAHARIHGDLSEGELTAIADRVRVVRGRPVLDAPAGYTAVSTGSYRPAVIREMRYGTEALGETDSLGGGLTYTGFVSGGGYEDQLFDEELALAGPVNGKPAVVTTVFGGNGALAWEPAPGLIAYIGYSGSQLDDNASAALLRLAVRANLLGAQQWRGRKPPTVDQTNQPG